MHAAGAGVAGAAWRLLLPLQLAQQYLQGPSYVKKHGQAPLLYSSGSSTFPHPLNSGRAGAPLAGPFCSVVLGIISGDLAKGLLF